MIGISLYGIEELLSWGVPPGMGKHLYKKSYLDSHCRILGLNMVFANFSIFGNLNLMLDV